MHIPELHADAQRRKVKGVFQASSVDHISNIVKAALQRSKMKNMTCRSVRGASPSKVVQLFPDLLSEALKLGRWSNAKTFRNHYQAPVVLQSAQTPPSSLKTNIQQILRWGFQPKPPPLVSAEHYMKGPEFWVGCTVRGLGKIIAFEDGDYTVIHGETTTVLYHYELMEAISKARSS